jgi:hypothetical protein
VFHALPRISDTAVADLLQVIRARLLRYLIRRRIVEDDEGETRFLADDLAGSDHPVPRVSDRVERGGFPPEGSDFIASTSGRRSR